jgi:hypothetical protein
MAILRQTWVHVGFFHWEVEADRLQALLPPALEVDTFEGRAYVGLVPFLVKGSRPVFTPPLPVVSRFRQVNVRTYVRRGGKDPGVWFFSMDVTSMVSVLGARIGYRLACFPARARFEPPGPERPARFWSRRLTRGSPGCACEYRPEGPAAAARPGTLEHFLVERYVLYASGAGGRPLIRGQVRHRPWPLQRARAAVAETLVAAAGISRPPGPPPLAHYAEGVSAEIFAPGRA